MRHWLAVLCLVPLWRPEPAHPQSAAVLGPEVRKYVRVSTPKVILEHVRIIDGTGAAPRTDQNIAIEDGKIAAIRRGADQPQSGEVTVLDLRGYAVIPGIVGMHESACAAQGLSRWLQTRVPQMPRVNHMGPDLEPDGHVSFARGPGETYCVIEQSLS